MSYFIATVS